ncbi:hypothetical protein Q4583_11705 [Neptunomonas phycophila]|jgi:hypothetical protein|uniref:hypothetical protein n=1 Tax=Neptunomonas TaxID=75687 RepID=UPI0023F6F334|nr:MULTISPECIES: hypothetical protein [Neptunomonas]MDN2659187.1 hypothetical protein [Neptunomonas sp. CHC150]MDO6784781.1 hypothetical protein [Neptunomonas phycophila]
MTTVVEIVKFTTHADVSDEQVLASCEKVDAFLAAQPGFLYRSLAKDNGRAWVDIAYWENMSLAQKASSDFMDSEAGKEMIALIDMDTCDMKHLETRNILVGYDG